MIDQLESASNILLLAPALNPGEAEACGDILTTSDATKRNVLAATYTQSASAWAAEYERHVGDLPDQLAIVSVGETTRSTGQAQSPQPNAFPRGPVVEAVESPSDLTGLGIRISEFLKEWDTDKWNGGAPQTAFCFDSVTAMLQYTDLQRAFRFLHTVTGRISQSGAVGHYHLTPDAHDDKTVSTLYSLFDAVVEVTEDSDEWTVKTRNR